jgi:hypothetical protein
LGEVAAQSIPDAFSMRIKREEIHSSDGGRKAYLNFELKDQ